MVDTTPRQERVVIGADFNGHFGKGNKGDEDVMVGYGAKERMRKDRGWWTLQKG